MDFGCSTARLQMSSGMTSAIHAKPCTVMTLLAKQNDDVMQQLCVASGGFVMNAKTPQGGIKKKKRN